MKKPCGKTRSARDGTRAILSQMFTKLTADGRGEYAKMSLLTQRLSQCVHASKCGRLCQRLIKGPGVIVYCVDIESLEKTELYTALENPDFQCPEGRF